VSTANTAYPNLAAALQGKHPQDLVNVLRVAYDNINALQSQLQQHDATIAELQAAVKKLQP
jgi:prefoldin subunit 5